MWGIRAGIGGEAHTHFLKTEVICLADPGIGNLRKIPADRNSFYVAYQKLKPLETRIGVAGIGGKFFRFIHEITAGDLVVYPALNEGRIYVAKVTGQYKYIGSGKSFPHVRSVEWLCNFPKSELSEKARRELGAARTLFEVKRHATEIKHLVSQLLA